MATRSLILGFEIGHPGANPSHSSISVQTSVVRSGQYALRVNTPAGTAANVGYPISGGDYVKRSFFRGYLRIAQLPSVKRAIIRWGTTGNLTGYAALFLLPDGRLGLGERGNVLATSTTVLTLNTWYRVEVGYHCEGSVPINFSQLRINGQVEIDSCDLLSAGSGPSNGTDKIYLGALDTAASILDIYWDDIAIDLDGWPGPGRVDRLLLTSIAKQSPGYTLQGDAPDIVTALNTLDDNAWVTESNINNEYLLFDHSPVAADISQVRGITLWKRWRSETGSHYGYTRQEYQVWSLRYRSANVGTTYTWFPTTISRNPHFTQIRRDEIDQTTIGVESYAVGNPGRISCLVIEIDGDSTPGAKADPVREFIASCDTGNLHEFSGGNVVPSTNRVRTGTYSLRANSLAGNNDSVCVEYTISSSVIIGFFQRFYLFFEMLPPSGEWVQIYHQGVSWFSIHRNFGIKVRGDGAVLLMDSYTETAWFPTTITRQRWIRFEILTLYPQGNVPGVIALRIDGQLVAQKTDVTTYSSTLGTQLNLVGCYAKSQSTFPIDLYIDDIVVDSADWPGESKILDLVPSGPGAITGTGWDSGPTPGQPRWQQIRETPTDDAGSYVTSSLSTSDVETYAIADLPFQSIAVVAVRALVRVRSWPGSSIVDVRYGVRANNVLSSWFSETIGTTSWINDLNILRTHPTFGQWTVGLINGAEVQLRTNTANRAFAITNARLTVEYLEAKAQQADLVADGYIAGAYRKKELKATAYVEEAFGKRKSLRAGAIVVDQTPPAILTNRWYITNTAPSYAVGPAIGDWDVTSSVVSRKLSSTKAGIYQYQVATKRMMGEQRVLMIKAISDPLTAQRIDGSLHLTFAVASGSSGQMSYHVHVWVTQGDSGAVRGVLIDNWTSDEIWPTSTIGLATVDAENVNPVDIQEGDRIVVEIGYFDRSTSLTYGLIWFGGTGSVDLTDGSTDFRQPGHIDLEGALQKDPDVPTPVTSGAEITGDALLFGATTKDVWGSAAVQDTVSLDLPADGIVADPVTTRTLDLQSNALVRETRSHAFDASALIQALTIASVTAQALVYGASSQDLTADALVSDPALSRTTDLETSGLVRDTKTVTLDASATVQAEAVTTIAAHALVYGTRYDDLTAGAICQASAQLDLSADASILSTHDRIWDADAIVRSTQARDLTTSAIAQGEQTGTFAADGVVISTEQVTWQAEAIVQGTTVQDLATDAVCQSTGTTELAVDALLLDTQALSINASSLVMAESEVVALADGSVFATVAQDCFGDAEVILPFASFITTPRLVDPIVTRSRVPRRVIIVPF